MKKKKKYIDGIFNYCDSWCERCQFTSRCRNFAMQQKMIADEEQRDKANEEFWKAMKAATGDAMEELSQKAAEIEDPEPEAMWNDDDDDHERMSHAEAGRHRLGTLSWRYSEHVRRYLSQYKNFSALPCEAVEIVAWYHLFIHVKLCRALMSRHHEKQDEENYGDEDSEESWPKDSDGSAKIAIIGMERSISGWMIIGDQFPEWSDEAKRNVKMLIKLRAYTDRDFPEARRFRRPGFDDVGE